MKNGLKKCEHSLAVKCVCVWVCMFIKRIFRWKSSLKISGNKFLLWKAVHDSPTKKKNHFQNDYRLFQMQASHIKSNDFGRLSYMFVPWEIMHLHMKNFFSLSDDCMLKFAICNTFVSEKRWKFACIWASSWSHCLKGKSLFLQLYASIKMKVHSMDFKLGSYFSKSHFFFYFLFLYYSFPFLPQPLHQIEKLIRTFQCAFIIELPKNYKKNHGPFWMC